MYRLLHNPFVPALLIAIGATMLVVQAITFIKVGWLSSRLIGGGLGFIVLGGLAWFTWCDELGARRISASVRDEPEPTADEYDQLFSDAAAAPNDERDAQN
jgi:hypothetical protein